MRRILHTLALVAAMAAPARALTVYCADSAPDSRPFASGTNAATPISVNTVNASAAAGDVVIMLAGTTFAALKPANNGTSSAPITIMGDPNNRAAVLVADVQLGYSSGSVRHGDYCVIRNLTSASGLRCPWYTGVSGAWTAARGVRFANCVGTSALVLNGFYCVAESSDVLNMTANHAFESQGFETVGAGSPTGRRQFSYVAAGNEVRYCNLSWTHSTTEANQWLKPWGSDSLFVHHNNITLTNSETGTISDYVLPIECYAANWFRFEDNVLTSHFNTAMTGTRMIISLRDHSSWPSIARNTIVVDGTGSLSYVIALANSGSYGASCRGARVYGNTIKVSNTVTTAALGTQNDFRDVDVRFNRVYALNGTAFGGLGAAETTTVAHNTFVSGAVLAAGLPSANFSTTHLSRWVSNVVASTAGNSGGAVGSTLTATSGVSLDSMGVVFARSGSRGNGIFVNGVGNGTVGTGSPFGLATKAMWGASGATDSTYASWDPTLLAGSAPTTATLHDGYAGAIDPPPAAVSDLALVSGKHTMGIAWTAPGADNNVGTATAFDLRRSTSAISDATFGSATPVTTPAPELAGTSMCFVESGLDSCMTFYYALKSVDEKGQWSTISNLPSLATKCTGSSVVICDEGLRARPAPGSEVSSSIELALANPMLHAGSVSFAVPGELDGSPFSLAIYDISGRRVATLAEGTARAGRHSVESFTFTSSAAQHRGVYFVRLQVGESVRTRTLIYLQ